MASSSLTALSPFRLRENQRNVKPVDAKMTDTMLAR